MPNSMTSFSHIENSYSWGNLVWELRSVNHRYLDIHFKLPECARPYESNIREKIKAFLSRGKVECFLRIESNQEQNTLQVNQNFLTQLINANTKIADQLHEYTPEQASTFLKWPGVIESGNMLPDNIQDIILIDFDEALKQLVAHREREGITLSSFIQERLVRIQAIIDVTRKNLPGIIELQHTKIREKINQISTDIDQDRLEQELVFIAQKADIAEELDRLEAHLKEIRLVLKNNSPCGRRLDFLMQELNREANTLGSKSINIGTSQTSIDLKVLIEQMREQIQNIE